MPNDNDSQSANQPAGPTLAPAPTAANIPSGSISNATVPKSHHKCLIAIIILVVLMLTGVAFGAYGVVTKIQNDEKIASLQDEITQRDDIIKQTEDQLGTNVKVDTGDAEGNNENSQSSTPAVQVSASADYIYIGAWGIKIKIPENLKQVSYLITNFGNGEALYVDGLTSNAGYTPDFVNMLQYSGGLGSLVRCHVSEVTSGEVQVGNAVTLAAPYDYSVGVIFVDGEYFYAYDHPQAVMSVNEQDQALELETAEIIEDMLRHNISKF